MIDVEPFSGSIIQTLNLERAIKAIRNSYGFFNVVLKFNNCEKIMIFYQTDK